MKNVIKFTAAWLLVSVLLFVGLSLAGCGKSDERFTFVRCYPADKSCTKSGQ